MKKSIILIVWIGICLIPTKSTASLAIQTTQQLHQSKSLNYVDKNLGSTLNLYKSTNNNASGKKLYNPLNIYTASDKPHTTLRERRLLKKTNFFKSRRSRQYKRYVKKMNFYKDRRRKKFRKKTYLWKWFQRNQLLNSKKVI